MGHMILLIIVLNKSIESNGICKFENDLFVPNVPNMTNSSSRMVNFNFQIRDSSSWIDLFESTSMHDLTKQTSITKGLVQNCEKHYWNSILNRQYFTLCHEPINYVSFHSQFHILLVQLVKKSIIGDPWTMDHGRLKDLTISTLYENEQFSQKWINFYFLKNG